MLPTGSATGDSKYDSLQIKATKRFSHGFQASGAYTWAKGFTSPTTAQDFFNPNANPWAIAADPAAGSDVQLHLHHTEVRRSAQIANEVTKDWEIGFFATYQSGIFLTPPNSTTANFLPSQDVRTGQPLYLQDINNIHSYNPVHGCRAEPGRLGAGCLTNGVGPAQSTLYSDFRGPRQPRENANLGRHFRFKERYDFYIRGEFVNIFNRTILPNPITDQSADRADQGRGWRDDLNRRIRSDQRLPRTRHGSRLPALRLRLSPAARVR